MGQLRTRKRGKYWEWSFEGAKIGGKRNPISKSGYRTKAEAIAAGTQAKAEYDSTGRSFSPSEVSVSDYLDYWFENYVQHLSYYTRRDYEVKIRLHIKPALGQYRLAALEPDTIQRWVDSKKAEGLAQNTVKCIFGCLSGALEYAVQPCRYIKFNPCQYVKVPRYAIDQQAKAHTEYICTPEDYQTILDRFPEGSLYYLPIVTGYHLGARIGEIYGIDLLQDVNFKNHTVTVSHQLMKQGDTWFYRPPKYNSCRTVDIDPVYEGILKREISRRRKNMLRYGEYFLRSYLLPDGSIKQVPAEKAREGVEIMPLSVREDGELLTPANFKNCAAIIHKKLGLTFFHAHCLRHTHGTILAENGASPKTIMERLGHKDIKVTMERYVFNTEKMRRDAVNIFAAAIRKAPTA